MSGRLVPPILLLATAVAAPQQQYVERVDVARLVLDVRVVDGYGRPVLGLESDDFRVRMEGREARVESAYWVGADSPSASGLRRSRRSNADPLVGPERQAPGASADDMGDLNPPGRLIVFLFQKSLEGSRAGGLQRMLQEAQTVLDRLTPADRVAVLSFDFHLRIWSDFTADFARIRGIFDRRVLLTQPDPVRPSSPPSLVARLQPATALRTYSIERALRLIGEALEPLPGAKSLVLIGHGFGNFGPLGVSMEPEYDEAVEALVAARATVFCLDITNADYHSLEAGLKVIAEDTGGFFERTYRFSAQALTRLTGALSGHYVLFVEAPATDGRPVRRIEVELTREKGTVMAKRAYVGSRIPDPGPLIPDPGTPGP